MCTWLSMLLLFSKAFYMQCKQPPLCCHAHGSMPSVHSLRSDACWCAHVTRPPARPQLAGQAQPLAVVDIPLLYESGAEQYLDAVAVASAPAEVQRQRVLGRPGMTEQKYEAILARQVSTGLPCRG